MVMFSSLISISTPSSFHSILEQCWVEGFSSVPPTALINYSSSVMVSASAVMIPCPESPVTESGRGSKSAINLHSSSFGGSIDLAPSSRLLGGHSGSSSQFSSLSLFKVNLVAVEVFCSATYRLHIPCRELPS